MRIVKKFQTGGQIEDPNAMAAEAAAPAEQQMGGQDPIMQIAEIFAQGLQEQNCELLAQGAQMFLELLQQASSGAPEGGQPVFAKGGKMVARKQASFKLVRG